MNQVFKSRVSCLPNVRPDLNRTRYRRGVFATPAWPPLILPFGFPLVSFRHFLRVADQNKPGTGDEVMRLAADRDAWPTPRLKAEDSTIRYRFRMMKRARVAPLRKRSAWLGIVVAFRLECVIGFVGIRSSIRTCLLALFVVSAR